MLLTVILILVTIALDQWTKYLAVTYLTAVDTLPLWEGVLHLTYLENRGAAFGMLSEHRWVFMVMSVVSIGLILVWLVKEKPKSLWIRIAAGLIVGGGIGNMIDRVVNGYVVDFIDVRAIDFYVFNGADSFVCVGCAMVMLYAIVTEFGSKKKAADGADTAEEACGDDGAETDDTQDGTGEGAGS